MMDFDEVAGLLAEAEAKIATLEAQLAEAREALARRDARLANIAALARKHQAVSGPDGNWAAVEGFATIDPLTERTTHE